MTIYFGKLFIISYIERITQQIVTIPLYLFYLYGNFEITIHYEETIFDLCPTCKYDICKYFLRSGE